MPSSSPLAGRRVVDLSRHLPGPLASHLLADLGAHVIKVEEPRTGDPVRESPPTASGPDGRRSALATLLLSGADSIALDLKRPAAREVLLELLETADVLVESFRPGTLARLLGLDLAQLGERFPRLVICSVSGWGQDGPRAARSGHDLTYQALAGSLAPTGAMPAVPVADLVGAWSAVAATLAALLAREAAGPTGRGAHVDAPLYDAAFHANLVSWAELGADRAARRPAAGVGERRMLSGSLPCYRLYRTADGGLLAVAPLEGHFWNRFLDAAGRTDLVGEQYEETTDAHRRVAELVAERTRDEWTDLLDGLDLPVEPVLSAGEAADLDQARARDLLRLSEDDRLYRLGFPARIDGVRPRAGGRFPALGESTDRVVERLGGEASRWSARERRREGIGRRLWPGWKNLVRKVVIGWKERRRKRQ